MNLKQNKKLPIDLYMQKQTNKILKYTLNYFYSINVAQFHYCISILEKFT
jgi:hypothetical protein